MTMVRRDLDHSVKQTLSDSCGRLLLLEIEIGDSTYVVGNIYAPTADSPEDQADFLDSVEAKINELNPINIIIGGDFNVSLDPLLDRTPSALPSSYGEVARKRILTIMGDLDLYDIWRYRNPSL